MVLDDLLGGSTIDEITQNYEITKEQVEACIAYASSVTHIYSHMDEKN